MREKLREGFRKISQVKNQRKPNSFQKNKMEGPISEANSEAVTEFSRRRTSIFGYHSRYIEKRGGRVKISPISSIQILLQNWMLWKERKRKREEWIL